MIFHRHHWREAHRTYNPPIEVERFKGNLREGAKFVYGFTNIEYRCACGAEKVATITGRAGT